MSPNMCWVMPGRNYHGYEEYCRFVPSRTWSVVVSVMMETRVIQTKNPTNNNDDLRHFSTPPDLPLHHFWFLVGKITTDLLGEFVSNLHKIKLCVSLVNPCSTCYPHTGSRSDSLPSDRQKLTAVSFSNNALFVRGSSEFSLMWLDGSFSFFSTKIMEIFKTGVHAVPNLSLPRRGLCKETALAFRQRISHGYFTEGKQF